MDMRPIGVFDSGLGGLTAVRSLRQILPEENLIYFGDTARVPYGGRSKETLLKYARQDVRFLRSSDIKAILIACGTVSTTALETLQAENDLPIVGVVEPTPSGRHDFTRVADLCRHFRVPLAVIINKADLNPAEADAIEAMCAENGHTLLGRLPFDPVVTQAMVRRQALTEFDNPVGNALKDMWSALQEIKTGREARTTTRTGE